jgi:hypothetical protein
MVINLSCDSSQFVKDLEEIGAKLAALQQQANGLKEPIAKLAP